MIGKWIKMGGLEQQIRLNDPSTSLTWRFSLAVNQSSRNNDLGSIFPPQISSKSWPSMSLPKERVLPQREESSRPSSLSHLSTDRERPGKNIDTRVTERESLGSVADCNTLPYTELFTCCLRQYYHGSDVRESVFHKSESGRVPNLPMRSTMTVVFQGQLLRRRSRTNLVYKISKNSHGGRGIRD